MRPHGTQEELEKRRRRAIQLLKKGEKSLSAIARWFGASKSSVSRWFQAYQEKGSKGLKSKTVPGRPPKLLPEQKEKLAQLLLAGPLSCGYRTDLWTLQRVAQVIQKNFGIQYHPNHVWRLLLGMGWSCQKPERRALQRKKDEIAHWRRYRWPHIKKAERLGAHLLFLDESGFLLIPPVTRTWAPKGKTPYFYHHYRKDKISAISSLAVSPKRRRLALFIQFRTRDLMAWMFGLSLKICSSIFGGLWSFCGIGLPSIVGRKLKSFWPGIRDCGWSIFRLMRRNSILRNMFGIVPIIRFATVPRKIWLSLKGCCGIRCESYEDPRAYSGHAFMPLIYHGLGTR